MTMACEGALPGGFELHKKITMLHPKNEACCDANPVFPILPCFQTPWFLSLSWSWGVGCH